MHLPPQMVLFDCDGVLVDSERITNTVLRDNLAAHGLDIPVDEVMELFVGGTMMGVMGQAREMGADLPDTWLDDIYGAIFAALGEVVELVPGVSDVLDALDRAGIPYAVGSNGPHEKMRITLARTGLAARLRGKVYSREDVPNPKPAPDVYLKAASDAGIDPENCVVIEDSPSGARAAKAAGMACFGFVADGGRARMAPICDQLFDDMGDVPGLLGLTPTI